MGIENHRGGKSFSCWQVRRQDPGPLSSTWPMRHGDGGQGVGGEGSEEFRQVRHRESGEFRQLRGKTYGETPMRVDV